MRYDDSWNMPEHKHRRKLLKKSIYDKKLKLRMTVCDRKPSWHGCVLMKQCVQRNSCA